MSSPELVAPQKRDISRSFSDEKTFFRTMHVVKLLREYPQSLPPPTAGFIVLVAGATVGLIVPVLLFGAATISYATLPSVEMETKTEQRETARRGFIHRMFDGIQYMFSGALQRLILVLHVLLGGSYGIVFTHHYLPPV